MLDLLLGFLSVGAVLVCVRIWIAYFSTTQTYKIGNGDLYRLGRNNKDKKP